MNANQIEINVKKIIENVNKNTFIYDFLLAYGLPKASITRLKKGNLNLSKNDDEILWKKKLLFKQICSDTLLLTADELKKDKRVHAQNPRFIIVTNYKQFVAYDTKTDDSLDIKFNELGRYFDFFLPWAGMEKAQYQNENPADVKAAERMAKLFDQIIEDNPSKEDIDTHELNVFLIRLLFCFFAEDTEIFEKGIFTNFVSSHTQEDGSDLSNYFEKLFDILNSSANKRNNLPAYLIRFPYVNGGLFKEDYRIPKFSRKSRHLIIESGHLDWSQINPDIFGSMMQAVVGSEKRSGLGMHYTSVPNIMKVIEPLFLNELHEEFEKAKGNKLKLNKLQLRLSKIKFFDPACGSGNFLIIAYKELRRLEMDIINELGKFSFSEIHLSNFYGIEIDDFACEVAKLSLWLAEHQMNVEFKERFGRTSPTLPLKEAGNIVNGNATRLDWEEVCPKGENDEIYVLGNPPYLGSRNQEKEQKSDMKFVFSDDYKSLDYIACWFYLGSKYIDRSCVKLAFVTTNSINQGEQVSLLWERVLGDNLEIFFAYKSFKWINNAKFNAGVSVSIIGIQNRENRIAKYIFENNSTKEVVGITPYLVAGKYFSKILRTKYPISKQFPIMTYGNLLNDGGHLIFTQEEYTEISSRNEEVLQFIRKYYSSHDFLNSSPRYCLYISSGDLQEAVKNTQILRRLVLVSKKRTESSEKSTRDIANQPYKYYFQPHQETDSIIVPRHTSEKREYIPIGYFTDKPIISDSANVIYEPKPFIFSIISSRMHMTWVRAVAGRLKTDYRYSSTLCYNTFPFPEITESKKQELTEYVYSILNAREQHSEKTLAQLYDPEKMPDELIEAHRLNDLAVERCYRSKPFENDEERLEYLFQMYEGMIKN